MADLEKKTKRYPTDLTDEEWERIKSFLPSAARKGRKPSVDFREVLNAVRYIARAGCGAHAAQGFSALADGLLVAAALYAAFFV